MAIGTITTLASKAAAVGPLRADPIKFPGDDDYPTGGTPGFQALVRSALEAGAVTIMGSVPGNCGGYVAQYDLETDKLLVYYGNYDAADGPLVEVPAATDLSAVTFQLTILSK